MKTIGAKELRLNLDDILERVANGEEIIVSHRLKKHTVKLSPVYEGGNSQQINRHAGLKAFDQADKLLSPYDPEIPLKQLYNTSMNQKYLG